MKDEPGGLERRLEDAAERLEGSAYTWDHEDAAVIREAAGAIGEARRAMLAMRAAAINDNRGLTAALELTDAALARLEGGA